MIPGTAHPEVLHVSTQHAVRIARSGGVGQRESAQRSTRNVGESGAPQKYGYDEAGAL